MIMRQSPTAPPQYVRDSKVAQVPDRALVAQSWTSTLSLVCGTCPAFGRNFEEVTAAPLHRSTSLCSSALVRKSWHCRICVIGMRTSFDLKGLP